MGRYELKMKMIVQIYYHRFISFSQNNKNDEVEIKCSKKSDYYVILYRMAMCEVRYALARLEFQKKIQSIVSTK